jgi:hypothetical protein
MAIGGDAAEPLREQTLPIREQTLCARARYPGLRMRTRCRPGYLRAEGWQKRMVVVRHGALFRGNRCTVTQCRHDMALEQIERVQRFRQ